MLAQLFIQQIFIIYYVLGSVLDIGIIKRLFLDLKELMTLRKRQVGEQRFPVPNTKGKTGDTRCLWAERQSPEPEQLRKSCLDIQGLNKQRTKC